MKPEPDPQPTGGPSLPARSDSAPDQGLHEHGEGDLWDLDLDEGPAVSQVAQVPRLPEPKRNDRPIIRHAPGGSARIDKNKASSVSQDVKLNVRSKSAESSPVSIGAVEQRLEQEFEELDDWDQSAEVPGAGPALSTATEENPGSSGASSEGAAGADAAIDPVDKHEPPPKSADEAKSGVDDAGPSPWPRQPLLRMERIGLAVFVLILAVLGATAYYWSIHQLPKEDAKQGIVDFPQKGKWIAVAGADTYWREPVLKGGNADRVRRRTSLIPVVDLEISGGSGALRIRFRDHDRQVVGDPVTRRVGGSGRLNVAATAGFDDVGMHAAYRTGQLDAWTVEVYEADSEDASGKDFSRLFEMKLSSHLRKNADF